MNAAQIRRRFVDFFVRHGHAHVPSSALVPADDPTLLFTNAGMVQFKRVFLGEERRDYVRATTVQKCVRAGGKHNDLEQVGVTRRHHTFFEMLGNFSFGDYFKRDAIAFAWEFVTGTEWLGLSPDRLRVTVHHTDDEARALWREIAGLPDDRIYGLGDKDNFWQMGDTGPCGPCTEIYVDLEWREGDVPKQIPQAEFEELAEAGRFLEIWNLVFMQFDRSADGTLTPLPKPSVDTGAGLERIAAVLQGEDDNFHADTFAGLLAKVGELVGRPYDRNAAERVSYRVLADHARAVSVLLADGVVPSNEGRGYVLRRILRRGVRHAWLLGRRAPTLAPMTDVVIEELGEVYPELRRRADDIRRWCTAEEERFLATIEGGMARLEQLFAAGGASISGEEAFVLYDTFGFPVDLTQLIAAERGWSVDFAGFEERLAQQRKQSRDARKAAGDEMAGGADPSAPLVLTTVADGRSIFVGYGTTAVETMVLKSQVRDGRAALLLADVPFYAESGGQVSDEGTVQGEGWTLHVQGVRKTEEGYVVSGPLDGHFVPGRVQARVDEARRRDIERNHSATHLAHMILRRRLGQHVKQAGSRVDPERLRFDFAHHGPIDPVQLREIEHEINELIWRNDPVEIREMPKDEALKLGAMAFFQDKYGDVVRVVAMGDSIELCGGTHVRSTGQIGLFRFVAQGGVAAGVRRIEARTGRGAFGEVIEADRRLEAAATLLKAQPDLVVRKLEQLIEERARLEAKLSEALKGRGAAAQFETIAVGPLALALGETALEDRDEVGRVADAFRDGKSQSVLVLLSAAGKGAIHVAVTDDLVQQGRKAGELAGRLAAVSGGKGGGRPHFASAGAGDAAKLGDVRAQAAAIVAAWAGV
jgi:alanyl-tRNA synthetase